MFKRSNFIAKYRVYAKTLKALQNKATSECSTSLGNKYEKLNDSLKTVIENSQNVARESKVLSIVHNKISENVNKSKARCANLSQTLKGNRFLNPRLLYAAAFIKSDPVTISDNVVIEPIPEPPSAPDLAAEAASQLNALGESTFASLGLGGWTPVGIVQNCFEFLHVSLGIPWWEAIAIGTLVIRFALFPLVIMAQRNAAKMNNHLPQMQVIQLKMTEARQSGNQMEVARYSQELMMFMKEKNVNPFKNMIVPLAQMPVFVSFFMGLRQMANVPVDSLRTGGIFWFSDLTVPDQFFALPVITSLTLWATIELGTDAARLNSQNLQTMKYVLRALPFVILPFTVNFPGAILCYWLSSNVISLGQVGFLKIPAVRDYFKIDPMLQHDKAKLPIQNKGFVGGLKDSWTNIKITKEIEERRRLDELQFQRAGKGPLVKTYKYDPTKQVKKTSTAQSAIKSSN